MFYLQGLTWTFAPSFLVLLVPSLNLTKQQSRLAKETPQDKDEIIGKEISWQIGMSRSLSLKIYNALFSWVVGFSLNRLDKRGLTNKSLSHIKPKQKVMKFQRIKWKLWTEDGFTKIEFKYCRRQRCYARRYLITKDLWQCEWSHAAFTWVKLAAI